MGSFVVRLPLARSHRSPPRVSSTPFEMNQVHRINASDPGIAYSSGCWATGTEYYLASSNCSLFFMFRFHEVLSIPNGPITFFSFTPYLYHLSGTAIQFYGSSSGGASLWLTLDGDSKAIQLKGTASIDEDPSLVSSADPSLVFTADSIADGDHQLSVDIELLKVDGSVRVHYFMCVASLITFYPKISELKVSLPLSIENSSGQGFDILNMGPNATNVPTHAIIVDDASLEITYNSENTWDHLGGGLSSFKRSSTRTYREGASLSYSFDGVAIW